MTEHWLKLFRLKHIKTQGFF
uniref:Uncharacterized protein n=1 Tax=Anguilla anguilla TaxID=7936 RepID=A0A0E9VMU1_ANGAN